MKEQLTIILVLLILFIIYLFIQNSNVCSIVRNEREKFNIGSPKGWLSNLRTAPSINYTEKFNIGSPKGWLSNLRTAPSINYTGSPEDKWTNQSVRRDVHLEHPEDPSSGDSIPLHLAYAGMDNNLNSGTDWKTSALSAGPDGSIMSVSQCLKKKPRSWGHKAVIDASLVKSAGITIDNGALWSDNFDKLPNCFSLGEFKTLSRSPLHILQEGRDPTPGYAEEVKRKRENIWSAATGCDKYGRETPELCNKSYDAYQ